VYVDEQSVISMIVPSLPGTAFAERIETFRDCPRDIVRVPPRRQYTDVYAGYAGLLVQLDVSGLIHCRTLRRESAALSSIELVEVRLEAFECCSRRESLGKNAPSQFGREHIDQTLVVRIVGSEALSQGMDLILDQQSWARMTYRLERA